MAVVVVLGLALWGCGGGGSTPAPPPPAPPAVTQVVVVPANPSIQVGAIQQFTATVSGTGSFDSSVTWAVEGIAGGNQTVGTITDSGLYATPFPTPASVTITATSKADKAKSGSTKLSIAAPPAGQGPALTVDAAAGRHPISPLIYGMNAYGLAAAEMASTVRLPVDRWGGDATTRYNYLLDVSNAANDWYFETSPNDNGKYPDVSDFNSQVERDRLSSTLTMGTIPLIGWTTKRLKACSYSVKKYGAQKETDPYNSDCGKGVKLDGTEITADPSDTSTPIGVDFARNWVTYLVSRYGNARNGGVAIYCLDNEPELWQWVHKDVHPQPLGYDDFASLGIAYAQAIKQADPAAAVSGPVVASWTGYFYSPKDWFSGWATGPSYVYWGNPVDRKAHGDVPFLEWYLQQFAAYEQQNGQRLLDYFDLHGYLVPDQVQFKPAGDVTLQQVRLDATRVYWDATYKAGGDINDFPRLIPRMRGWVNANYPGTRTAITEYNLGALDHINGALAQADVLGIFGRESLDLATLWGPPENGSPGMFAFKVFRNYDDAGSGFGDTSVSAASADQSKLSVYAAERSSDGALTILVINKAFGDLNSTLSIANFNGAAAAKAYRYSKSNLNAIVALPDQAVNGSSIAATFPAASITLFVIFK